VDGYAFDDEEFLPGLLCLAVQVPADGGRSNLCVALQGPTIRLNHDSALQRLPALQRAAAALARIHADDVPARHARA